MRVPFSWQAYWVNHAKCGPWTGFHKENVPCLVMTNMGNRFTNSAKIRNASPRTLAFIWHEVINYASFQKNIEPRLSRRNTLKRTKKMLNFYDEDTFKDKLHTPPMQDLGQRVSCLNLSWKSYYIRKYTYRIMIWKKINVEL